MITSAHSGQRLIASFDRDGECFQYTCLVRLRIAGMQTWMMVVMAVVMVMMALVVVVMLMVVMVAAAIFVIIESMGVVTDSLCVKHSYFYSNHVSE